MIAHLTTSTDSAEKHAQCGYIWAYTLRLLHNNLFRCFDQGKTQINNTVIMSNYLINRQLRTFRALMRSSYMFSRSVKLFSVNSRSRLIDRYK